jgi:hypothetical protein
MLPFYGTGDYNSDALIIDTIHRLPSHALEMADVNGQTLLILACQFAAYDLLPTLLSKGCDVNASNNIGVTPLHCTCFSESFSAESAMTLIRHGAIAEVVEHDYGELRCGSLISSGSFPNRHPLSICRLHSSSLGRICWSHGPVPSLVHCWSQSEYKGQRR